MAASSTRTEGVYDDLRSQILNGGIRPGQKLRMVELANRFGASQSVVREALTRLAAEGLVLATPQRGFRVRELSVEDIISLTETRVHVESVALRLAIERGDVHWETHVLATHHLLERLAVEDGGIFDEAWKARHRDFHRALLAGCNNARLVEVAASLRDGAELYNSWSWVLADDHHRDVAGEHARLRDLALARDADAACELLGQHIERAPQLLIAAAAEHGVDHLDRRPSGVPDPAR